MLDCYLEQDPIPEFISQRHQDLVKALAKLYSQPIDLYVSSYSNPPLRALINASKLGDKRIIPRILLIKGLAEEKTYKWEWEPTQGVNRTESETAFENSCRIFIAAKRVLPEIKIILKGLEAKLERYSEKYYDPV